MRFAVFLITLLLALSPAAVLAQNTLSTMEHAVQSGQFQKIGSILVEQNGHIVYEHYFQGDAQTLRDTRSATKSITSILLGIAIDSHKVSGVSMPLLSFFPDRTLENPDPRKARITLEDLLTMSSLLECDDWNDFSRGNEERMYTVEDWTQFTLNLPVRGYMRLPDEAQPKYGRRFSYCTAGAFLIGQVLQKATGEAADVYAQRVLFDPLDIHDARWVYSPLGAPQTGGGLRLTSRDLLKFAELYRSAGKMQGKQIVSADWVRTSTTPHVQVPDQGSDKPEAEPTEYGYFWWLKTFRTNGREYPSWYMSGNGGNKIVVVPSLRLSVVITSTNYNTPGMHQQTEKLLTDYILPSLH